MLLFYSSVTLLVLVIFLLFFKTAAFGSLDFLCYFTNQRVITISK